jgi:hypothetical protein
VTSVERGGIDVRPLSGVEACVRRFNVVTRIAAPGLGILTVDATVS